MKKNTNIIFTITILLLLSANIVYSFSIPGLLESKEKASNVVVPGWYGLADWELQECSVWGGTEESQIGARTASPIYLSQTTLTLQGQKRLMPDNTTFYEVSWYFHPNELAVAYTIIMSKDDGTTKSIGGATANPAAGSEGYYYTYLTESDYTFVKMDYVSNWIEVPIVSIE